MLFHKLHTIVTQTTADKQWYNYAKVFKGNYIREIKGLTVGILGYGSIGREASRQFAALGANIVALTRDAVPKPESGYIIPGTGDPTGTLPSTYYSTASATSTLEFFAVSDVVVNALPDSVHTRGFVGEFFCATRCFSTSASPLGDVSVAF